MSVLSSRASAVLYAVVTEYIGTGEPVGSRTLSSHYGLGLSSATIRNVLKDLEEDGLLSQPHKSAGRVPTRRAYQVFIDALMKVRRLPPADEERIRYLFEAELGRSDLFRESGRLLSELSGVPAIIFQSRSESRSVEKIRFIPTRSGELLSVIVLDDGSVENRFISTDEALSTQRLERVHLLVDELTQGLSLAQLRQHLGELVERDQSELHELMALSGGLVESALSAVGHSREVIIEGRSSLLGAHVDPHALRRLMVALEDRQQLVTLLNRCLASTQVQVFLGQESEDSADSPLSVVAAPYRGSGARPEGALGVLGPTRMNYPELIPLVGAMAQAISGALGDGTAEEDGSS